MIHWGRYEELRPREIEEIVARHPIAYIPWGALEYHSHHNPVGLDGIKAHGLCLDLAKTAGGGVLPAVYHATSTIKTHPTANQKRHSIEHGEGVVETLARELIRQLIEESFKVIVLLTGHCGEPHFSILKRVGQEMQGQHPECWIWVLAEFEVLDPALLTANHSARGETALQLHYRPDLVSLDRVPEGPAPTLEKDGVWGEDPRRATAAEGQAIARAFVEQAAARIRERLGAGKPSS